VIESWVLLSAVDAVLTAPKLVDDLECETGVEFPSGVRPGDDQVVCSFGVLEGVVRSLTTDL
jgi:hypothetical protein